MKRGNGCQSIYDIKSYVILCFFFQNSSKYERKNSKKISVVHNHSLLKLVIIIKSSFSQLAHFAGITE